MNAPATDASSGATPVHEPLPAHAHYSQRNGWLRAAVLGANDGLISTASLLAGVAAAQPQWSTLLLTGVTALVGGAVSMAAGEYVSVSSQADTERADRMMEARMLHQHPQAEEQELVRIYEARGLTPELAAQVAAQLMAHDALDAHVRDEIGITDSGAARPIQAALASAAAFVLGAVLPLLVVLSVGGAWQLPLLGAVTLLGLAALGFVSARLGGAQPAPAVARVVGWGVLALGLTIALGHWLGGASG